ncbi:hypothetical protein KDW_08480 [Dictyobacter vulcani]|uniref:Uncharacterized protein n=1 Tax=Dictyobacter vulcani TaxID=2607529 RepID=A0A5J4KNB0_9CHLR|nr:hypothetical protein [Dictyobacter vulcani]GER86686.1 hypothetical protein KDW_08480 [Dictyobacter vulcani]
MSLSEYEKSLIPPPPVPNYTDTQEFADLVKENPAAAYTEGLGRAINASRQQRAPRPGFFGRLRSAFSNDEDPGAGAAVSRAPRPTAPSTSTEALPADYSIETQSAVGPRLNTSLMTPEQLRVRRMNLVEGLSSDGLHMNALCSSFSSSGSSLGRLPLLL